MKKFFGEKKRPNVYSDLEKQMNHTVRRIVFALLAVVPPVVISFFIRDVEFLVGITGSYAGLGIMFLFPALLVQFARKYVLFARKGANHWQKSFGNAGSQRRSDKLPRFSFQSQILGVRHLCLVCFGFGWGHIPSSVQGHSPSS